MDNSDSMNHIEWHPAFDSEMVPDATYCAESADFGGVLDPNAVYSIGLTDNNVKCSNPVRGNRDVYGVRNPKPTYWSGRYLMWYLGLDQSDTDDAAILNEIDTAKANVAVAPLRAPRNSLPRGTGARASRRASRFSWTCCVSPRRRTSGSAKRSFARLPTWETSTPTADSSGQTSAGPTQITPPNSNRRSRIPPPRQPMARRSRRRSSRSTPIGCRGSWRICHSEKMAARSDLRVQQVWRPRRFG